MNPSFGSKISIWNRVDLGSNFRKFYGRKCLWNDILSYSEFWENWILKKISEFFDYLTEASVQLRNFHPLRSLFLAENHNFSNETLALHVICKIINATTKWNECIKVEFPKFCDFWIFIDEKWSYHYWYLLLVSRAQRSVPTTQYVKC